MKHKNIVFFSKHLVLRMLALLLFKSKSNLVGDNNEYRTIGRLQ